MEKDLSRSTILQKSQGKITHQQATEHDYQIIDVRSAAEFLAGSMSGAINIPLFDENERSVVGTIYHHGGKDQAIEQGFEIVEKKLNNLLGAFEGLKKRPLAVFCARGGMRSLSIVNLLLQSGYDASQIEGGYKKYRHDILEILEGFSPKLIVIHGLTGTGKTRILQHLQNSIDLEELAKHRSSLFGGLEREPSNQRSFDSTFVKVISDLGPEPYFVEGESRKIGRVFIPKPFAVAMKEAVLVNVHCSLETRIARIVEDYPVTSVQKREEILQILRSLKQKMGTERVDEMCDLLLRDRLSDLVAILLVDYYDKRYARSMSDYQFELDISSENIKEAAEELTLFRQRLL